MFRMEKWEMSGAERVLWLFAANIYSRVASANLLLPESRRESCDTAWTLSTLLTAGQENPLSGGHDC